jgi:hypothetical protein
MPITAEKARVPLSTVHQTGSNFAFTCLEKVGYHEKRQDAAIDERLDPLVGLFIDDYGGVEVFGNLLIGGGKGGQILALAILSLGRSQLIVLCDPLVFVYGSHGAL